MDGFELPSFQPTALELPARQPDSKLDGQEVKYSLSAWVPAPAAVPTQVLFYECFSKTRAGGQVLFNVILHGSAIG